MLSLPKEIQSQISTTKKFSTISALQKNEAVASIDSLMKFDPKSGFYLKPKFAEEHADPWGQYYCQNEETKEKSGVISIQPAKGYLRADNKLEKKY